MANEPITMEQLTYAPKPKGPSPDAEAGFWGALMGPAWRTANPIVSAATQIPDLRRYDESFDWTVAMDKHKVPWQYAERLLDAGDEEEFLMNWQRLQQEVSDQQYMAQAGWAGMAAGMVAGTVTPTALLPGMGPARGMLGAAQSLGLAAIGASIDESILYATQDTYDKRQLVGNIAVQSVFGAILGEAGKYAIPKLAEAFGKKGAFNEVTIPGPDGPRVVTIPHGVDSESQLSRSFTGELDLAHGYDPEYEFIVPPTREELEAKRQEELAKLGDTTGMEESWQQLERDLRSGGREEQLTQELLMDMRDDPTRVRQKPKTFEEDFEGPRYGSVFGDENVVYLDADGRWIRGEVPQMSFRSAVAVRVKFDNALRLGPDTVDEVLEDFFEANPGMRETAEVAPEEVTVALGNWAKREGHDGLLIEPGLEKTPGLGEYLQPQVVSFDPKKLTPGQALSKDAELNGWKQVAEARRADSGKITSGKDSYSDAPGQSVGAAAVRRRNTSGLYMPANGPLRAALKILRKINPIARMATHSFSPTLRDAAFKMDAAGLRQANLEFGPSVDGGDVASRARVHDKAVVDFVNQLEDAYYRHITGKKAPTLKIQRDVIGKLRAGIFGAPPGKMTFAEFKEAVYEARVKQEFPSPEVKQAADALGNFFDYYAGTVRRYEQQVEQEFGGTVGKFWHELAEEDFEEGAQAYAHEIWDHVALVEKTQQFIQDFSGHMEKSLAASFERAQKRVQKAIAKVDDEIKFLNLSAEGQDEAYRLAIADLDEIDAMPEYANHHKLILQELKDLRDLSQGMDPKELAKMLRGKRKELEEAAPDSYKQAAALRKDASDKVRLMRKYGASTLAEIENAKKVIETEEAKATGELWSLVNKAEAFWRAVSRKQDALTATETAPAVRALAKLHERLAKVAKQIEAPRRKAAPKLVAKLSERQEDMWDELPARIEAVQNLLVKKELLAEDLAALHSEMRWAIDRVGKLNSKRAVKAAEAEAELKELFEELDASDINTASGAERLAELQKRRESLDMDFHQKWAERGAQGNDLTFGKADFREAALELATDLHQRLTTHVERPAGSMGLSGFRGAELARMLKLPYDFKKQYLVRDAEKVAMAYDRNVAPDMELYRMFGSVNGERVFSEMKAEHQQIIGLIGESKFVKLPPKTLSKIKAWVKTVTDWGEADPIELGQYLSPKNFSMEAKPGYVELTPEIANDLAEAVRLSFQAGQQDFRVGIERLRAARGRPADPDSVLYRTGQAVQQLNTVTLLGSVVPASLSDVAMPVFKYGVARVVGRGWGTYIRALLSSDLHKIIAANKAMGVGLDIELHSRSHQILEIASEFGGRRTLFERMLTGISNKIGVVALFDRWTAGMKHVVVPLVKSELDAKLTRVAGGQMTDADRIYFAEMGLSPEMALRIGQQFMEPGGATKMHGILLPDFDKWADKDAYIAYSAAIQRGVNTSIVTPGLERPNFSDQNIAFKLLTQFKSFMFAVNSRIVMGGLQGTQPYVIQGTMSALAMGALSYYATSAAIGGQAWEKAKKGDPDDWIYESVKRSGLLGALSWPVDVAEQTPGLSELAIFGGQDQKFKRPHGIWGAAFGPTAGKTQRMFEIASELGIAAGEEGELKRSTLHKMRSLFVPFQNVFYLRRAFDQMENLVGDALNAEGDRR